MKSVCVLCTFICDGDDGLDTLLWVAVTNHLPRTHDSCHVCVGRWCQTNKHLPEAELRGPLISGMPCYVWGVIQQPMRFYFSHFLLWYPDLGITRKHGKKKEHAFSNVTPWLCLLFTILRLFGTKESIRRKVDHGG
jgi:hypothetical protein